jgi:hypothetical protein
MISKGIVRNCPKGIAVRRDPRYDHGRRARKKRPTVSLDLGAGREQKEKRALPGARCVADRERSSILGQAGRFFRTHEELMPVPWALDEFPGVRLGFDSVDARWMSLSWRHPRLSAWRQIEVGSAPDGVVPLGSLLSHLLGVSPFPGSDERLVRLLGISIHIFMQILLALFALHCPRTPTRRAVS